MSENIKCILIIILVVLSEPANTLGLDYLRVICIERKFRSARPVSEIAKTFNVHKATVFRLQGLQQG